MRFPHKVLRRHPQDAFFCGNSAEKLRNSSWKSNLFMVKYKKLYTFDEMRNLKWIKLLNYSILKVRF